MYKTYVFVIKYKEGKGSICDLNINVFVDKYIIRERIFRERYEIKIITVLCAIYLDFLFFLFLFLGNAHRLWVYCLVNSYKIIMYTPGPLSRNNVTYGVLTCALLTHLSHICLTL